MFLLNTEAGGRAALTHKEQNWEVRARQQSHHPGTDRKPPGADNTQNTREEALLDYLCAGKRWCLCV